MESGAAVEVHAHLAADACDDDRYPRLAGEWLVGCEHGGDVDAAWSLRTGERVELDAGRAPGVGDGVVYAADGRAWRLPDPRPGGPLGAGVPVAPPAVDGTRVAVAYADHLERYTLGDHVRPHLEARPLPWYAPALAGPLVAWVERSRETGEDVWVAGEDDQRRLLAGGPGDQRHVVGAGDWLAWVEPGAVVRHHVRTGETTRFPADTGFRAPPALGPDGVVCWEDRAELRAGGDIDLRCSDGLHLDRPGDQRAPSRSAGWLAFHEGKWVMLLRLPPTPKLDAAP